MVIVSIIVKARIVFRGDAVRDEENQAAVFDQIAASAPTSRGGLSLIVALTGFFQIRLRESLFGLELIYQHMRFCRVRLFQNM